MNIFAALGLKSHEVNFFNKMLELRIDYSANFVYWTHVGAVLSKSKVYSGMRVGNPNVVKLLNLKWNRLYDLGDKR